MSSAPSICLCSYVAYIANNMGPDQTAPLGAVRSWFILFASMKKSGPEVKKLEFIFKLKIKRNDWLLTDTCLQAANHYALF